MQNNYHICNKDFTTTFVFYFPIKIFSSMMIIQIERTLLLRCYNIASVLSFLVNGIDKK